MILVTPGKLPVISSTLRKQIGGRPVFLWIAWENPEANAPPDMDARVPIELVRVVDTISPLRKEKWALTTQNRGTSL